MQKIRALGKLFSICIIRLFFGRSPTGRAIHCNLLFVTSQKISVAIPNAKRLQKTRVMRILKAL
jgi:hypothetical protein